MSLRGRPEVLRFLDSARRRFGSIPGVQQVSLAYKRVGLTPKSRRALVVGVDTKRGRDEIPPSELIPSSFKGIPTDVIAVRELHRLDCPIDLAIGELPLPHRPGGWIGEAGSSNWGSVCLFVHDQHDRVFALTARHVAGGAGENVLDKPLTVPTRVGCTADRAIPGTVVRETTVNWEFYDAVLVLIPPAFVPQLENKPYGSSVSVQRVIPAALAPRTKALFHGARLSYLPPQPAEVMSPHVVQVQPETGELTGGRTWIEFNATLAKGDSGGLFTTVDGRGAIGMLQLGRRMTGDSSANPVYATPLATLFAEFAADAAAGSSLDGFKKLRLSVL